MDPKRGEQRLGGQKTARRAGRGRVEPPYPNGAAPIGQGGSTAVALRQVVFLCETAHPSLVDPGRQTERTPRMPGRSRPPLCEIQPRRIGLIKPSALGDIVHTLPLLTALRRRYPDAHITWIVNRSYEPLLIGHPHLDATLPFDRGAVRRGLWAGMKASHRFPHRATAAAVRSRRRSSRPFPQRPDDMGNRRCSPRRHGNGREGASWFYTDCVPPRSQCTPSIATR